VCTFAGKEEGEVSADAPPGGGRRVATKTLDQKMRDGEAKKGSRSSRVGKDGHPVVSAMHPGLTNAPTNNTEDAMLAQPIWRRISRAGAGGDAVGGGGPRRHSG
jgi:hypothetical protein